MTKLLDQALEMAMARTLPADAQDDIARVILRLSRTGNSDPIIALTPQEQAAIAASKAAAVRNEFATEGQVRSVWAKHGL